MDVVRNSSAKSMERNVAQAARDKDWEEVRRLVEQGENVNAVDGGVRRTALHYAVMFGNPEICSFLLSRGANVNPTDKDGNEPLHAAARRKNADICQLLVDHQANVTSRNNDGDTPLLIAAKCSNDSRALWRPLVTKESVNLADRHGNCALYIAITRGHSQVVQMLVDCGADMNAVNESQQTRQLHTAASGEKDCPELCSVLLEHKAKIDAVDEDGNQPLHWACKQGHTKTCWLLLSRGANVKAVNKYAKTPLLIAAGGNKEYPDLCSVLLEHEADVDAVDADGNQPLHLACKRGHFATGSLLLSHGADVTALDKQQRIPLHLASESILQSARVGSSYALHIASESILQSARVGSSYALHIAADNGNIQAVQLLVGCGTDVNAMNSSGKTPLHTAAGGKGDCSELCLILLEHNVEIDAVDEDGNQPLHLACKKGHTRICMLLLSNGADVNAVNRSNQTALHAAASSNRDCSELCSILLEHKAKIDAVDEDGNQPLHLACKQGHTKTCWLLLSKGADVKAVNKYAKTPLLIAAGGNKEYPDLCSVLLEHEADVDAVDADGNQPLHLACKRGHFATGSLLLSHGADVTALDKQQRIPLHLASESILQSARVGSSYALHIAADNGNIQAVQLLVGCGADVNAVNRSNQTPLLAAASSNRDCSELCSILLEHKAKIDAVDEDGNQPLHLACRQGHIETCTLLLSNGADVNAVNRSNQTPLLAAASSNRDCSELCSILLEHKAKIDAVDEDGNQPLHLACKQGHTKTCRLLLFKGADVKAVNKYAKTPLLIAAGGNKEYFDLCSLLLEHEADVDAVDADGNQPLHLACKRGHFATGSLLLSHGADVTALDKQQRIPLYLASESILQSARVGSSYALHIAADNGNIQAVQLLVGCGADVNAVNRSNQTPLLAAASSNRDCSELCSILLEHKAKIDAVDEDGNQPLHLACRQGHIETCTLLLSNGADVNAVNRSNQTPLLAAASSNRDCSELCSILLEHKAKIDAMDEDGNQSLHLACKQGHTRTCWLLVSNGADVNAVNRSNQTALHAAASSNRDYSELCSILLEHKAKIDAVDEDGKQPLHLACKQRHAATGNLLLSHGADVTALDKQQRIPLDLASESILESAIVDDSSHALHIAADNDNIQTVQLLVGCGADVNALNKSGQTPLHTAAGGLEDCRELCSILVEHKAKIDTVDEDGNQPLHLACKQGHTRTCRLLLSKGADVKAVNRSNQTPLLAAASSNRNCSELCSILLEHKAKIDAVDKGGNQSLHLACKQGHTRTCRLLLSNGADVKAVNRSNQTPLHAAASSNRDCSELCSILLEHKAKIDAVDKGGNQSLHLACKQGHTRTCRLLLSNGADVKAVNRSNQTPLHAAASSNRDCSQLCSILLEHKAKIDAVDEDGNQSLHLACKQGHTRTCRLLLSNGADVKAVNRSNQTPLHAAASSNRDCSQLCSILLEHKAKIDAVDEDGNQSLHLACKQGHTRTCRLLLSKGADVKAVNRSNQTPLHAAASSNRDCSQLCSILLKHKSNIDAVDEDGNQPLHLACKKGHTRICMLLLSNGADVNSVNRSNQTALHAAASSNRDCSELCSILLEHKAKIDAVDEDGNQPLHLACKQGHTKTCWLLLSNGADVKAVNKYAKTPLLIAAGGNKEYFDLCSLLLEHEADVDAVDADGNQPLHLACKRGHFATGSLLLSHGADVTALDKQQRIPLHLASESILQSARVGSSYALHIAADNGNIQAVQLLVGCGADVNAVNRSNQTPLLAAASSNRDCSELCSILLEHKAKIDAVDEDGNQPLHLACKQRHAATGNLLLSHGADVTALNKQQRRPLDLASESILESAIVDDSSHALHIAAENGNIQTVQLLVGCGADVNALNKSGQTPLHTAAGGLEDCRELCSILVEHKAKIDAVDEDGNQPLHLACKQGHTRTCRLLLSNGADVKAVNRSNQTPLHAAASSNRDCSELCSILLEHKAKIDAVDEDGNQSLHLACKQGHTRTCRLLLSKGADVKAVNRSNQTPLLAAASSNRDCSELCSILLKHKAKIDAVDKDGNQPLHLACKQGHTRTCRLLLSNGADVKAVNRTNQTPLHAAAGSSEDCSELCSILLQHEANIDAVDEDGNQPLHLACKDYGTVNKRHPLSLVLIEYLSQLGNSAHSSTVRLLINCGAPTNAVNRDGQTPLHTAAGGVIDSPELCSTLLKYNARIDAVDKDGNQPLHLACESGLPSTVKHLLDCNADVFATNNFHQTALHKAAFGKNDCPEVCAMLIAKGASVNATDGNGATSLQVAFQKGHMKTVDVLVENGADRSVLNVRKNKSDCMFYVD